MPTVTVHSDTTTILQGLMPMIQQFINIFMAFYMIKMLIGVFKELG